MVELYVPKLLPKDHGGTIDGFIRAVEAVLEYWLGFHDDPHVWASSFFITEDDYVFMVSRTGFVPDGGILSYSDEKNGGVRLYVTVLDEALAVLREELSVEDRFRMEREEEAYLKMLTFEHFYRAFTERIFPRYREKIVNDRNVQDIRSILHQMKEARRQGDHYGLLALAHVATQSYHSDGLIFCEPNKGKNDGWVYASAVGFNAWDVLETVRSSGWQSAFGDHTVDQFLARPRRGNLIDLQHFEENAGTIVKYFNIFAERLGMDRYQAISNPEEDD